MGFNLILVASFEVEIKRTNVRYASTPSEVMLNPKLYPVITWFQLGGDAHELRYAWSLSINSGDMTFGNIDEVVPPETFKSRYLCVR